MNRKRLEEMLNRALLTDEEMARGPRGWAKFKDPFDYWDKAEEEGQGSEMDGLPPA
jgi:hypothetical protein